MFETDFTEQDPEFPKKIIYDLNFLRASFPPSKTP
jgi:hypothetical protein